MSELPMSVRVLLILTVATAVQTAVQTAADPRYEHEYKLHNILLGPDSHYSKDARPVLNSGDNVTVKLYPEIIRIEGIDERTDTLTTSLTFSQNWEDTHLKWDPAQYGNISTIHLPLAKIWCPDITLYNVASGGETPQPRDDVAIVSNTGSVTYIPYRTYSSYCPLDLEKFPYDTQTCPLMLGPWVYHAKELDMEFWTLDNKTSLTIEVHRLGNTHDNDQTGHHPLWTLVGNSAQGSIIRTKYDCCPETYSQITITMQLKRVSTFYRYVAIGPSVVLALLIPVQFLLPVSASPRTTFGLLIILSFTILISTLSAVIPFERGTIPKIGVFYVASMTFASLGVLVSTILAAVANKGTRRRAMPAWLHSWCLGAKSLRRLVCVDNVSPVHSMYSSLNMRLIESTGELDMEPVESREPAREMDNYNTTSVAHLRSIAKATRVMAGKTITDDALEKLNNEWQDLAKLLDRVFFILFSILVLVSCFSLVAIE